ncbi:exosortase-dependent surface protein XDP2 [Nostoc sp. UHCC 0870]|uniref:exosortase-dependent surface protein XDP2 n=1 Tax=Nostoc sp. UHCC 0870 TaxID=2914041 RepID=UPI001EDF66B3|nr:exosortase-dependent surface protein XDP2 [Nostoc sp. UHCC 0870]UKO96276.1 PEP-CTERM sorting domain-containing protein [Nostoc sp. UHCC 0870]
MKAKNIFISTGLVLSAVLGASSSAQAASFVTKTNPDPVLDPTQDIFLESITQDGQIFTPDVNLFRVNSATIISNTPVVFNVPNTGAASSDKGDNASNPISGNPPTSIIPENNPDNDDIKDYLGNFNLNNIIDTEDNGAFEIDLTFETFVSKSDGGRDNLFFYERGSNSDLLVQALDTTGNTIGTAFKITRNLWTPAGYSINTLEVASAQAVGSYGLNFLQLGLADDAVIGGVKLIAESSFNGPDFKVFAGQTGEPIVHTPEPTTMIGLGSIAGLALLRRRQTKKASV